MSILAVKSDGVAGSRLISAEIDLSGYVSFSALVKMPPAWDFANIFIWGKRDAATNVFWYLRLIGDPDDPTGMPFHLGIAMIDSNGLACHYNGGVPNVSLSSWYQVGFKLNTADLTGLTLVQNGVEYAATPDNVPASFPDAGCGMTWFGPADPTSSGLLPLYYSEIAACNGGLWNRALTTAEWALLGGVTRPGEYADPYAIAGSVLRAWRLNDQSSPSQERVINDTAAWVGGISSVAGPSGVIMGAYSSQPDSTTGIDARLSKSNPDTNTPNGTTIGVGNNGSADWLRLLNVLDLTEDGAIPAGSTASAWTYTVQVPASPATLGGAAKCAIISSDAVDIVESQVTWNSRKTGTPWSVGGGDLHATQVSFNLPTGAGALALDVTSLVQIALTAGWSKIAFVLYRVDETTDDSDLAIFGACENATAGNRPALAGSWTAPTSGLGQTRILPMLINGVI